MKIKNFLHSVKEALLSISSHRNIKHRIRHRLFIYFLLLAVVLPCIFWPLLHYLVISFSFLITCLFAVIMLHKLPVFQRKDTRNLLFLILFFAGSWIYLNLAVETQKLNAPDSKSSHEIIRKTFLAIHNGNISVASFFPSRGSYEISGNGFVDDVPMNNKILGLYVLFHACAYIFAGYFFMSLWGFRTINRLQFFLARDCEKNVFWCFEPKPWMIMLAKDILLNAGTPSQPVFSVAEENASDPSALFQQMNFYGFCLKLRKPGQVHEYCLSAAKHFFLTENPDWNVSMADTLLKMREQHQITSLVRLYIKVSDHARELFFNRWADRNNKPGQVEIILVNESEMIAEKFVQEHPMLDTISGKIDTESATVADSEFKVLIIGFGNIGRAILKHTICDCQFIDSSFGEKEHCWKPGLVLRENRDYHHPKERVPFSADILDCRKEVWDVFEHDHHEACERFNLKFTQMAVLTEDFYKLKWENLKNYNRIIIALGNAELNIEVAAAIEKIVRKNVALPTSGEARPAEEDPQKLFAEMAKRFFVISPEIQGDCTSPESQSDRNLGIYHGGDNLFNLVADNYEVYRYDYIVEEKLSFMGKLIDLGYNINFKSHKNSAESEADKAYEKLMEQYHLPFIPRSYSFSDFFCPSRSVEEKQRIMSSWYPRYDAQKKRLQAATMSDRKSSRASAANLRNIIRLLGLNENDLAAHYEKAISGEGEEKEKILNNLGRTEHLRWMAFSLLEENSVWKDPVKNETFQRANQTIVYYRHATLVEWDDLPVVDRVFPAGKTFKQKDLEIIENLALVYQEYNVQKNSMMLV